MPDTPHYPPTLSKAEKYLQFIYPVLMPVLTLFAFKIPVHSVQEALRYWLFMGFMQFIVLLVIKKAVYSTVYNKVIRWLIAASISWLFIVFYQFVDYNFVHFTEGFANPNMWITVMRNSWNMPILIALLESVKSFHERSRFNADNIALQKENLKAQIGRAHV